MLEARLLGQFGVRMAGQPVAISSRAAQSLLAYLLLHPGTPHRREQLAGLLWPDTSDANARRNLRQELWRLRKLIDPDPPAEHPHLLADDLSVSFAADSAYWLDVAVLEHAAANGASATDLTGALQTYQGELLPGFYDEWVAPERERLQALFEQLCARLVERLGSEGRWAEAREWADRWIALGHAPEAAYRALMLAHSQLGDMAQVAAAYQRCVAALRDQLAVEPSTQTTALYERLTTAAAAPQTVPANPPSSASETAAPAAIAVDLPPAAGESPFKGLRYFDEADAGLFFGRERLTAQLVARLRERALLVVVGASGSGKSSLVRAGLIPALHRGKPLTAGAAPGVVPTDLPVHLITPTAHPLEALAVTLSRDSESVTAIATLSDDMARDPRSLRLAIRRTQLSGNLAPTYIVVDQFEELFTLCRAEAERQAFIDNLLGAMESEQPGSIKLVVALRADFYAHCAGYANLRDAVAAAQAYIGPMSADELRRSIEGPAQHGQWTFEAGLVDLILRDVGAEPGALPLLSHALLETWQRRRGRMLTLKGYAECGGVRGAIAQTAETVFQQLTPERQAIARHIFIQLTELGEGTQDTRRRVSFGELTSRAADGPAVEAVVNILAAARLVTVGEGTVEVAHEALIREWPTLREWLNQDREGLRLHRHLNEAARAWNKLNRDEGELYRGARLAQALEWAKSNAEHLYPLELEFLDASQAQLAKEEGEREAHRQRELEAAQRLADAETQRAEAETSKAESERNRAEAETQRAEEQRKRAEAETSRAESERKRAEVERSRAQEQAGANRRLRRRALFLVGALVLVALLAASSAFLAQQSNENAARAEDERRTAFVRELAGSAVNNLDIDPERSILLALEAVSTSTAGGQPVMVEAEEALHRAVVSSRVLLTIHGHTSNIFGVALSPDGKRIATASSDKTAKVWDAATGQLLLTLSGHTDGLYAVAFSPDGTRLATASGDKTAKVWDAATGKELLTLMGHTAIVDSVAFSPDGTRIATASGLITTNIGDRTARLWDAATGKELLTLMGHTSGVLVAAFSPDGKLLATASEDHTARLWDAATGKELLSLGHPAGVRFVSFSPDGKRLATGSGDFAARIWDTTTGQLLAARFTGAARAAFDPAGTRMVTTGTPPRIWDAATGQVLMILAGHTGSVRGAVFSPDGTRLVTASDDATARVWDVSPAGGREWLTLANHTGTVYTVAYSADGTRLATASTDKTAKVWDAMTGQELLTLKGHTAGLRGIAFSPDGSRLVSTSDDQTARVWDAATGQELLSIPTQSFSLGGPLHVAISPDGTRFATAGPGDINTTVGTGVLKVWDMRSGQELLSLVGHKAAVSGVAYSPDGTRIATASEDRTAKIWDAQTGQLLLTLVGHTAALYDVSYSPDGRRIATGDGDGTAKVWDATTGQLLLTLAGHTAQVLSAVFSPDGTRLATASQDGTTKVWDISQASGRIEQPLTLYGHSGIVYTAFFSPDGKRLATASQDGTARVWALPLEDIVAIAKSRVTRSLTTDECQKYLHVDTCPAAP